MKNPFSSEALTVEQMYVGRLIRQNMPGGYRMLQITSRPYQKRLPFDGTPQYATVIDVALVDSAGNETLLLDELGLVPMPNGEWRNGRYSTPL